METPMMRSSKQGPMGSMMLARLVVLIVLLVGGIFLYRGFVASPMLPSGLENDQMKAVFLRNNQVYFGMVEEANKDFIVIKTPYYLQTRTVLQEPVEEGKEPQKRQQLTLAALGDPGLQIHGPEKEMYIPWDMIMYMENLRDDSEVVKLIKEDVEKGDAPATEEQPAGEQPTPATEGEGTTEGEQE